MNTNNILSSSNFWLLNKAVTLELGLETSIFLSDLSSRQDYWQGRNELTKDGYFFINRDKIKAETTLSHGKQNTATKTLINLGILEVKKIGLPSKNYYKINIKILNEYVLNLINKG